MWPHAAELPQEAVLTVADSIPWWDCLLTKQLSESVGHC